MQTDVSFYELFRRFPDLLFRLAGLPYEGRWHMESVTAKKKIEKHIDGLLFRLDEPDVYLFAEFQGYSDPRIYWRLFREISTWYETAADPQRSFVAVVLFLDPSLDPGDVPLEPRAPSRLLKLYLEDCLNRLGDASGAAVVFRPLVVADIEAARREAPAWRHTLQALNLPQVDAIFLIDHLITFLMGRFRQLSREEIEKMLQLTPIRETRAGREVFDEGMQEGIEEGIRIGQLQLLQRVLGLTVSSKEELTLLSGEDLDSRIAELERQLQAQRR